MQPPKRHFAGDRANLDIREAAATGNVGHTILSIPAKLLFFICHLSQQFLPCPHHHCLNGLEGLFGAQYLDILGIMG